MLALMLVPLASQYELRKLQAEQRNQETIRDALIAFATANRRLPCPDNDGDGREDRVPGAIVICAGVTPETGFLPWDDLGVVPQDTWGRRYQYHVPVVWVQRTTPGVPAPNATGLDLQDPGTITVQTRNEARALVTLTQDAAALVRSSGPNGYDSENLDGETIAFPAAPPTLVDENENRDGDAVYVMRPRTIGRQVCSDPTSASTPFLCEFDDILLWLPANILKLRLVEAGALP